MTAARRPVLKLPANRPRLVDGVNRDVVYVQRQWHVTDDDWASVQTALDALWAETALALRDGVDVREAVARGCDAAQDAVWPYEPGES